MFRKPLGIAKVRQSAEKLLTLHQMQLVFQIVANRFACSEVGDQVLETYGGNLEKS